MVELGSVARVVRSKNAGPYTLTLDIIFDSVECAVEAYKRITRDMVGALYRIDPENVEIILYKPANAVKINLPRLVPSGHPGDTDVYGAQQHAPLLSLDLDIDCQGAG